MISSIGSSNSYGLPDMETIRQNRFKKADADSDGKITKDELTAVIPKNGKGPSVNDIFSKVDTNGDGSIDEAEDKVAVEQMQKNGPPGGPRGGGPPDTSKMASDLFKRVDSDEDGKITEDELAQALSKNDSELSVDELLKNLDADEDGSITESELADGLKTAFEQMQANQPPPPPDGTPPASYDRSGNSKEESLLGLFSAMA